MTPPYEVAEALDGIIKRDNSHPLSLEEFKTLKNARDALTAPGMKWKDDNQFAYFWAREWDGDDSDLGQYIMETTSENEPPDENPNWFRLIPAPPAEKEM